MKQSPRSEGGFRLFSLRDIETLKFVRKAQELGFSLNEIRELLILRSDRVPACSHVSELLDRKLAAVEQKSRSCKTCRVGSSARLKSASGS